MDSWEQKGYRLLRNTLDAEVHVSDVEERKELKKEKPFRHLSDRRGLWAVVAT